jgi:hypothetical protein
MRMMISRVYLVIGHPPPAYKSPPPPTASYYYYYRARPPRTETAATGETQYNIS